MGFTPETVQFALQTTNCNVDKALALLLEDRTDMLTPSINEELGREALLTQQHHPNFFIRLLLYMQFRVGKIYIFIYTYIYISMFYSYCTTSLL